MAGPDDNPIYEALVIPNEALDKGGLEILRAGLIKDELYVTARPTFDHPSVWGEVLADITRRISHLYAAGGKYTHKDALAAISGAFAADLGAPVISAPRKPRASARKTTKRKSKPASKRAKTAARRKARR
jgi:Domain of unknown function (DUF5076)